MQGVLARRHYSAAKRSIIWTLRTWLGLITVLWLLIQVVIRGMHDLRRGLRP